jgi:hypothetical protein
MAGYPRSRQKGVLMRNTRVKVKREFLIEKIKEKLAREQKKYDDQLAKFEGAIVAQSEAVAKELAELSKKISKDPKNTSLYLDNSRGYRRDRILVYLQTEVMVESPSDYEIKRLSKTIRVLEAATDDTISVSTMDEYYEYL